MKSKEKEGILYTETRVVQGKTTTLEYLLTRKAVKNINIRIKSDKRILVSASKTVPASVIDGLILEKEKMIINALKKYEGLSNEQGKESNSYEEGDVYKLLGESVTLKVVTGNSESIVKDGNLLVMTVKDTGDVKRKQKLWNLWMKSLQEQIFMDICKKTYPLFETFGIPFPTIKIRGMKTMWGSCRPSRYIITLNSKLIERPMECIEYVVLHEFTHFIHPNHSKEFYQFVEERMPDWKERRDRLNGRVTSC